MYKTSAYDKSAAAFVSPLDWSTAGESVILVNHGRERWTDAQTDARTYTALLSTDYCSGVVPTSSDQVKENG